MENDPFRGQRSYPGRDDTYYLSEIRNLTQRLSVADRQADQWKQKYEVERDKIGSGPAFLIAAILFIGLCMVSHGLRSKYNAVTEKVSSELARAEYLKTILPLSPSSTDVASQCDAGKAFVGYRNSTGRALALVDFEVRGYLPNRVSNIVKTEFEFGAKPGEQGKAIPDARLDRIVQPGDSFSECVKLEIEKSFRDHADLGKATYKVKPVSFKFLEDYPGYVQDHTKN